MLCNLEESNVPLKPIYDKAPLMKLNSLPLRPGQARVAQSRATALYRMTGDVTNKPALWEGVFRLACVVTGEPMEQPVVKCIRSYLDLQGEDGLLPGSVADAVAVLRAAWAMYEYDAQRPLLEKIALWCGWACEHWEIVLADSDVRVHPADLMELLCSLYRVTGMKAVLSLCERLRAEGMDWSGALHTFSVQRGMKRMMPWNELEEGMVKENRRESGFYTRQYLTCHAQTLADGLRAAMAAGRYSGSRTELSAAKTGWERISRYHGAVCGGTTADELLGGATPECGVSAASLGAWAEAFAAVDEPWAYEALDVLVRNGLAAAVCGGEVLQMQRVNGLAADCGEADCYHVSENAQQRALGRLCRGYAAAISSAVTQQPGGPQVNLALPGKYMTVQEAGRMLLTLEGEECRWSLHVHVKENLRAALRIRIPAWTKDMSVMVNGLAVNADSKDSCVTLDRTWSDGDTVTVELDCQVRVVESGYHQSACVMRGNTVMVYPAAKDMAWNMALHGKVELNDKGEVTAILRRAPAWRCRGDVPVDLPVLPETEGDSVCAVLRPYAETPCRIALLPRGKQA